METNGTRRKAAGLVILVFVLGIAIGALGTRYWGERVFGARSDHRDHAKIVEDLTREVGLTPDQRKQLETIIEETRAKFQALNDQQRPLFDQTREEARNRVRAILTPEQRPKYEEFVRRLDEERKRRGQQRR